MSGFFSPRKGLALLIGLLLLGAISISSLKRASSTPQPKIEYWVVELDVSEAERPSRAIQERLTTLGKSGWELEEMKEAMGEAGVLWLVMSREKR